MSINLRRDHIEVNNDGAMAEEGDCPLCAGRPNDVVVELDAAWVVAPRRAPLPGYVGMVARSHAGEPFELGGLERRRYWNEILMVARAVRDATGANAITYQIDGHALSHVVAHVYPRFSGDPFSGGPIDGVSLLFERSSDEIQRLATAIREAAGASLSPATTDLDPAAQYDDMASWFDEQCVNGFYNAHYDRPAVLALIGAAAGQRILDVGCGGGHYLAALLDAGARVVGVDGSAELLARARARLGDEVQLVHGDLNEPLPMLADRSFDGVVLALVYHHIDHRAGLLSELRRVLKPGGWMVLSTSHPVSDWFQAGGSYFAVKKVTTVIDRRGARWEVPFWRMPLTVLLDEILSAGFRLERLVEHVPPPHTRDIDARLYRRLMDEPAFLALRLRRV
jgi:ubiquinone/menaquinone biosynthesis C-methylase UbiE/diadenosine tetraphosphate (Ap4A) HIT family hydrolase